MTTADECTCDACRTELMIPEMTPDMAPSLVPDEPIVTRRTLPRALAFFNEVKPRSAEDRASHRAAVEAGYASLKDYVAEYTPPPRRIIAFTGLAGSGKSTAALHLCDMGWTRVRFAGPLKAMMAALGLTPDEIEGHLKEQPCELLCGKTPRYAMQRLGTEFGRDLIGPDLWIRAWQLAVSRLPANVNVVVDDCRFANEAEAVLAAGGHIIRICRAGAGAGAAGHASEQEMASLPAASEIQNNGSVSNFLRVVTQEVATLSWVANRDAESMTTS